MGYKFLQGGLFCYDLEKVGGVGIMVLCIIISNGFVKWYVCIFVNLVEYSFEKWFIDIVEVDIDIGWVCGGEFFRQVWSIVIYGFVVVEFFD